MVIMLCKISVIVSNDTQGLIFSYYFAGGVFPAIYIAGVVDFYLQ
jgi:hypothetical protein